MACLSHAVEQTMEHAYAHHIQRLMVTGNFALLAGIDPDEVDGWYLGVYIDALEWVEITNTRGMSQFADGGIVSGPTAALVGEYAGARTNPEVIAPLDKLQAIIQGAGGGNVTVTGRLSGSDILLSSERSDIYRNRVRGF